MSLSVYVHIGYLVGYDCRGLTCSWDENPTRKVGSSWFKHTFTIPFMWPRWAQPVSQVLWIGRHYRLWAAINRQYERDMVQLIAEDCPREVHAWRWTGRVK